MYTRQPKGVRYIILDELTLLRLAHSVADAMEDGFEPIGGVSCTSNRFYQAMTRKESRDETKPSNPG